MKVKLQPLRGKRARFIATFGGYGTYWERGIMRRSVHLRNIWDARGKFFTTHAWVNHTPGFDVVGELQEGDVIEFTAQVDEYFQVSRVWRIFDLPVRTPTTGCQLRSPMNIRKLGHSSTSDRHGVKHDAHLSLFYVGTG